MKKKGFTLVELLVVIAIIAVLLTLITPALQKARMQARRAVCMSNMRQQSLVFNYYTNDNEGRFPDRGGVFPHFVKYLGTNEKAREALDEYVEDPWITICPALEAYDMDAGDIFKDPWATWYNYGGWATDDDPTVYYVTLGYTWFFNFISPKSGATAIFAPGEMPWPNRAQDANSDNVMASHLIGYYPDLALWSDWGHEASSGGRIFGQTTYDPYAFTSECAPLLYGDGSVIPQPKSEIKERAEVTSILNQRFVFHY